MLYYMIFPNDGKADVLAGYSVCSSARSRPYIIKRKRKKKKLSVPTQFLWVVASGIQGRLNWSILVPLAVHWPREGQTCKPLHFCDVSPPLFCAQFFFYTLVLKIVK